MNSLLFSLAMNSTPLQLERPHGTFGIHLFSPTSLRRSPRKAPASCWAAVPICAADRPDRSHVFLRRARSNGASSTLPDYYGIDRKTAATEVSNQDKRRTNYSTISPASTGAARTTIIYGDGHQPPKRGGHRRPAGRHGGAARQATLSAERNCPTLVIPIPTPGKPGRTPSSPTQNARILSCHKTDRPEDFNYLFCYCPLYLLGDKCGGNFFYTTDKGVKKLPQLPAPSSAGQLRLRHPSPAGADPAGV